MGMGLAEYYATTTEQEQPAAERKSMEKIAADMEQRQRDRDEAEVLKAKITRNLATGAEPQDTLYLALDCIGKLMHDPEWAKEGAEALNLIYEDLEQQRMERDNAEVAARRLDEAAQQYADTMRRRIMRQQQLTRNILDQLTTALTRLDEVGHV